MFGQQVVNSIAMGSIYALSSLGATLIYGILGILDIANAGAYVIGAYLGLIFYEIFGSILIAFLGAMILTGLLGILIQKSIYRPLLDKESTLPLIASIGIFILIENSIRLIGGPSVKTFKVDLFIENINFKNIYINNVWILIFIVTTLLIIILWYIMNKTKIGLAWRATAQNSDVAKSMGVNIKKVIALNFFLGYSFAAAGGILVGMLYNSINPSMASVISYKMLAIIVLGGLGNPFGAVVAAMIIGFVETMIGGYIGFFIPRNALAFVALVIILLIKPQGLFVKKSKL